MEGFQTPQEKKLTPEEQINKKTYETIKAGEMLSQGGVYAKEYVVNEKTGEEELTGRIEVPKHIVSAAHEEMLLAKGDSSLTLDKVKRVMQGVSRDKISNERIVIESESLGKEIFANYWGGRLNVQEKQVDEKGEESYKPVEWNYLSASDKKEVIEKIFSESYDEVFASKEKEEKRVFELLHKAGIRNGEWIVIKDKDGRFAEGYYEGVESVHHRESERGGGVIYSIQDGAFGRRKYKIDFEDIESVADRRHKLAA